MKKILICALFVMSSFGMTVNMTLISPGPPPCYDITVINDGMPPGWDISDFHFSVSCGIIFAEMYPDGWEPRYGPLSFWEADANPGYEIMPGEMGNFILCIDLSGCDLPVTYSLHLTGHDPEDGAVRVIPGTTQEGELETELGTKEETIVFNEAIYFFPNPFKSNVQIVAEGASEISIVDISGRVVKSFSDTQAIWTPQEDLESGIYFVRARMPENKVVVRKLTFIK